MSSPLGYSEYSPGPLLADVVECFWTSRVGADLRTVRHRVMPDGSMDLLLDFHATGARRISVIGTMTRVAVYAAAGPIELLGVRFRPGGLSTLVAADAAELSDRHVDLGEFWGRRAVEIWHRMGEADVSTRVGLLAQVLAVRTNGRPAVDPFIRHSVHRIEHARGGLRMSELERSTGLSARQLERKFARHIGVSPKMFARIVRFKGVLDAVDAAVQPEWARIGAELGFADQPHLVREFKAFAGLTPSDYGAGNQSRRSDVGFLQDVAETSA